MVTSDRTLKDAHVKVTMTEHRTLEHRDKTQTGDITTSHRRIFTLNLLIKIPTS